MLYLKITTALQPHLCISTNIKLCHELKKPNSVSVVQNSFFPLCNYLSNFLADNSVLSFHYKNNCTLLFKE